MKKVMFTGDSITDCGRGRPLGEITTLGGSYVSKIYIEMWAKDIESNVHIMNTATSGNTSRQLRERWESEVLAYPADYIFIMIGINDCWREFEAPIVLPSSVSPEEYAENMEYMIKAAIEKGSKPVIISPYFLEMSKEDPMRKKCDKLNQILVSLCEKYTLPYIDIQAMFDKFMEKKHSYVLSGDRVHPNPIGAQMIANAITESPVWQEIISK